MCDRTCFTRGSFRFQKDCCATSLVQSTIFAAGSIRYDLANIAQFTSPTTIAALTLNQQVGFTPVFTITNQCNFRVVSACTTIRNATSAYSAAVQMQPGAAAIESITVFQLEFVQPTDQKPVVILTLSSDTEVPDTCPLLPQIPILSIPGQGFADIVVADVNNVTSTGVNLHLATIVAGSSITSALNVYAALLSLQLDLDFVAVRSCGM